MVQVDSFFADENHTDSSMPFPPSDDSFADDSFPHDETQTGETMETEDGKGMDLDTALEAVAVEDPAGTFMYTEIHRLLDSPGLHEFVAPRTCSDCNRGTADDSFPHDETQTGETMETEDGKGMDLDTALEAVAVEDPAGTFMYTEIHRLLDSPGLHEFVAPPNECSTPEGELDE